jgi:hypothetical protein
MVSWLSLKTKVDGLSVVWPQNRWDGFLRFGLKTGGDGFSRFGFKTGGFGFLDLGLKTGSYGLVIWASKSPRRFIGLGLKTKQATVCRLPHKTDGRTTVWDTRRDLVTSFAWKQVGLGFLILSSRLTEAQRRVVHVASLRRLRLDEVEDGRVNKMGCIEPCYPCFIVFHVLCPRGTLVVCLGL